MKHRFGNHNAQSRVSIGRTLAKNRFKSQAFDQAAEPRRRGCISAHIPAGGQDLSGDSPIRSSKKGNL